MQNSDNEKINTSNYMDIDDIDNFNELCVQTIHNNTGVLLNIKYNDPHADYPNPNINKNKTPKTINVIQFN